MVLKTLCLNQELRAYRPHWTTFFLNSVYCVLTINDDYAIPFNAYVSVNVVQQGMTKSDRYTLYGVSQKNNSSISYLFR